MKHSNLDTAPLGQQTAYPEAYDAGLLFPILRATNRSTLGQIPAWFGADIWNAYEVSWLNRKGKPVVALARFTFAHDSPNLIESKSFKLYLNSFNEERLEANEVLRRMRTDLSAVAGSPVDIDMQSLDNRPIMLGPLEGHSLDDADIDIDKYEPFPSLLRCLPDADTVTETLTSDLLKSNCPVTGQPDWGSVQICYSGPQIDRHALLRYIISLRRHDEFHEHCVEKMYCDIWQICQPEALMVYARYTRRGGLDINPWRSSTPNGPSLQRTPRQ